MQVKQYNAKIFEVTVTNETEFLTFLRQNLELMRRYLVYIKGEITDSIRQAMDESGLAWVDHLPISGRDASAPRLIKRSGLEIVDRVIRSGQELHIPGDVLLMRRVNSGAKIVTDGNFIDLAVFDGSVECNGDFMLINPSEKALVIFNGVEITHAMERGIFQKVRFADNEIVISKAPLQMQDRKHPQI